MFLHLTNIKAVRQLSKFHTINVIKSDKHKSGLYGVEYRDIQPLLFHLWQGSVPIIAATHKGCVFLIIRRNRSRSRVQSKNSTLFPHRRRGNVPSRGPWPDDADAATRVAVMEAGMWRNRGACRQCWDGGSRKTLGNSQTQCRMVATTINYVAFEKKNI